VIPPAPTYPVQQPPQYAPAQYPPQYGPPPHGGPYPPPYPLQYPQQPYVPADAAGQGPDQQQFGAPTYHHVPAAAEAGRAANGGAAGLARSAVTGTGRAARLVTRKVISASRADGADESGLTALIWNQVLSYGTDAMIAVALAGTVFFGASAHAQRGNVLLYLLITMAPFAVVAPVIGPALDRFQHGRRWTMAATAVGRAVLALIMAAHPSELLVLYPCALGSLVLSKAYGVVRAAAAPRLVPPGLTLTETNARLSIFGLGSTMVAGAFVGVLIKVSGSYTFGLVVTAMAYGVCAFFAVRLPGQVDSPVHVTGPLPTGTLPTGHPNAPLPPASAMRDVPLLERLRIWATRGFADHLVMALQGESVLRFLSGLLTIFLAFYVEATAHGWRAALELGAVIGAAGLGNITGTGVGTKLKLRRPEAVIVVAAATAAVTCVLVAVIFNITMAVIGMLVSAITNSISKIALDAVIQRDVAESLRTSAFARSETFLQLSWVLGAAVGVVLPVHSGGFLGFLVGAIVVGLVTTLIVLRQRAVARTALRPRPQ
jgi:hypothetical protein